MKNKYQDIQNTKANIDDVNKALVEIHNELDSKSSLEDFNHAMNNQNSINIAALGFRKLK